MKKDYIIKSLQLLKKQAEKRDALNKHGVNLLEYDEQYISVIEEGIAHLLSNDEQVFDEVLDTLQWWLYDRVDKYFLVEGERIDVNDIDDFVEWLCDNYLK